MHNARHRCISRIGIMPFLVPFSLLSRLGSFSQDIVVLSMRTRCRTHRAWSLSAKRWPTGRLQAWYSTHKFHNNLFVIRLIIMAGHVWEAICLSYNHSQVLLFLTLSALQANTEKNKVWLNGSMIRVRADT